MTLKLPQVVQEEVEVFLCGDFAVRPIVREGLSSDKGGFSVFELFFEQQLRFLSSDSLHLGCIDDVLVGSYGADEFLERLVVVVQFVDGVFLVLHGLLPLGHCRLHLLVVFFEAAFDQSGQLRELEVAVHGLICGAED